MRKNLLNISKQVDKQLTKALKQDNIKRYLQTLYHAEVLYHLIPKEKGE